MDTPRANPFSKQWRDEGRAISLSASRSTVRRRGETTESEKSRVSNIGKTTQARQNLIPPMQIEIGPATRQGKHEANASLSKSLSAVLVRKGRNKHAHISQSTEQSLLISRSQTVTKFLWYLVKKSSKSSYEGTHGIAERDAVTRDGTLPHAKTSTWTTLTLRQLRTKRGDPPQDPRNRLRRSPSQAESETSKSNLRR